MGRRGGWKQCGFRRLLPDDGSSFSVGDRTYHKGVTWCGETKTFSKEEQEAPLKLTSCNKCSAAIGKAKLARSPGRVRLEKLEKALGYMRSSYALWIDGTHKGFIQIAAGWGVKWQLNALRDEKGYSSYGYGETRSSGTADYFEAKGRISRTITESPDPTGWPVHFASKEAMAVLALALFDHDPLTFPTQAQRDEAEAARLAKQEADKVERAASQARYEAQRIEDRRVRDERLEAWRLAFPDLLARDDLTNLERAGLEAAQALIVGS